MIPRTCVRIGCGRPAVRLGDDRRRAQVCQPCHYDLRVWPQRRTQTPLDWVVQDAEMLAGTDDREGVAHRLGYKGWSSLERVLHRGGHHDLAAAIRRGTWLGVSA